MSVDPFSLGKIGVAAREKKKKKKWKVSGSPSSDAKPKERLARKPKMGFGSLALDSDSLLRLRDDPEEDDIFVSHGPISTEEQATT